jgi:hypothetical protein
MNIYDKIKKAKDSGKREEVQTELIPFLQPVEGEEVIALLVGTHQIYDTDLGENKDVLKFARDDDDYFLIGSKVIMNRWVKGDLEGDSVYSITYLGMVKVEGKNRSYKDFKIERLG